VDTLVPELREHPALRRLVAAVQGWRAATDDLGRFEALRRYNEAAATLIGFGITLYDLDPMDMLPDELMPLVWQEAYAEAFANAVAQGRGVTAAD
jgi:hypothetical protein